MLKQFPKILISTYFLVLIMPIVGLLFLSPTPGQAADTIKFTPQVGIDDTFKEGTAVDVSKSTKTIGEYIKSIYKYAIGIVGIVAVVVMMLGGFLWITAAGNSTQIESAKSWIGASLTGLLLVLFSYAILKTVNPALVDFKITDVKTIEEIKTEDNTMGCCLFLSDTTSLGYGKCTYGTKSDCTSNTSYYSFVEKQCILIDQCPQYGKGTNEGQCEGKKEGDACSVDDDSKIRGLCDKNGICNQCKEANESCTWKNSECCNGKCSCNLLGGNCKCN